MYKIIYPDVDSTIYEKYPDRNTSIDQIIELTKYTVGERKDDVIDPTSAWESNYNSRILIKFDVSEITPDVITKPNFKALLNLTTSEVLSTLNDFSIEVHPIKESWLPGNGNYNDSPEITNGVSWTYKSNLIDSDVWDSSSLEYVTNNGGGTWQSPSSSVEVKSPFSDITVEVTNIIEKWVNNEISNNGFIIKHTQENESNSNILGSIKFFSRESHTIYLPKLQLFWDDEIPSSSLEVTIIDPSKSVIFFKNNKEIYSTEENFKLRLGIRELYRTLSYNTQFIENQQNILSDTIYFSIIDQITNHIIIPFNDSLKVMYDSDGYFINVNCNNFLPERYYKIKFKIKTSENIIIIDRDELSFRIKR